MAITPADIRDAVLREDDFGHEMRVGRIMRRHDAGVIEHGGTYVDSVSRKPRQFDFRWQVYSGNAVLHLAVECKNASPEVPVIVCGTERVNTEAFHMLIESRVGTFHYDGDGPYGRSVVDGRSSITRQATGAESFYAPGDFVGKNLLRIRPEKVEKKSRYVVASDADVYDKWSQALASAVDLTIAACDLSKKFAASHVYSAILPVVVLPDSVLWTVIYDRDGNMIGEPRQARACEFYVGREIRFNEAPFTQRFCFSHIHFLTLAGFESFLSEIAPDTEGPWQRLFNIEAPEIFL